MFSSTHEPPEHGGPIYLMKDEMANGLHKAVYKDGYYESLKNGECLSIRKYRYWVDSNVANEFGESDEHKQ